MSKIEAEAKSLVRSQVDLVPILQDIANTHATIVDGTSVVVATQFPYKELFVNTDTDKLKEIVDNLMQNAVKFTDKGRVTLGYDITDGEHVCIWVKDTGKGIAESDQKRIFERFVKLDEYVPGTGLGLSVAKSHAESLGGTIKLESTVGVGSTFQLELPLN
jgi:signal transduction histidine kinase